MVKLSWVFLKIWYKFKLFPLNKFPLCSQVGEFISWAWHSTLLENSVKDCISIPNVIINLCNVYVREPKISFFFFCLFCLFRAAPTAYRGSQARGAPCKWNKYFSFLATFLKYPLQLEALSEVGEGNLFSYEKHHYYARKKWPTKSFFNNYKL